MRADLGADHARDVDLARAQGLQRGPVVFGADEGVLAPGDVAQARLEQAAPRVAQHPDALAPVAADEGHLEEQRAQGEAGADVGGAVVKVGGVVRMGRAHEVEVARGGRLFDPALAVGVRHVGAVIFEQALMGGEEVGVGALVGGQRCRLQQVLVAIVQKGRDLARSAGGERLDGFARAVVEGLDRVGDGRLPGAKLGVAHHVRQGDDARGDELPELGCGLPGERREQYQRHHLDRDEDRDELRTQAQLAQGEGRAHWSGGALSPRCAGADVVRSGPGRSRAAPETGSACDTP